MIQELWVKRWQINLIRRLEEHGVHQVLVLLPAVLQGVQVGLGGDGCAGWHVSKAWHWQVLQL